jgi:hemoglobin/transferrin/lactoferrin receptor protein
MTNPLAHHADRPTKYLCAYLHPLSLAALLACSASAWAQTTTTNPATQTVGEATLKPVIVSGSRSEQGIDDVPATVEVIGAQQLEADLVRDIRDLVRDIPNVSVKRAPARFSLAGTSTGREGNAGFNIRGLEGNRVLILTDGIREPRSYAFGSNSFGRDYQDVGLLKRVEIIKGPASALYGSDGLAGMVNFITLQPEDFLANGKTIGGRAGINYSGDDKGIGLGATVAGKASDSLRWMLNVQHSGAKELDNKGSNDVANIDRTTPNPQKDRNKALLAKMVFEPSSSQKHSFALQHVDQQADYKLLSTRAKQPFTGSATQIANAVLNTDASNDQSRDRLSWEGRFKLGAALADNLQSVVSLQKAQSRSVVTEDRNTSADRVRDVTYNEDTLQLGLQAEKTVRMSGGTAQKITYGIDFARTDVTNLNTGITPPFGEAFPLKRFPDTRETSTALYLQNEIFLGDWTISPAVRWDRFSIDAAQAGFSPPSATPAASLSGSAVSPKLGVMLKINPAWSVYGNYASGFKAPDAGQINAFFENLTSFYKTIPNPNLKPEKSQNFELGARARMDALSLDVAAFTGRYKDLIEESSRISGAGVAGDPTVFQSVNIGKATISGFEIKAGYQWGKWAGGALSSTFSYGQTRGKDDVSGTPLNSVNPATLSAGLAYKTTDWDLRLGATHHSAKKLADTSGPLQVAPSPAPLVNQFVSPAATTLDISSQYRIRKDLRVNFAIRNLTDKKYWLWSSAKSLASNSVVLDSYTQPGRSVHLSLVTDF